MDPHFQKSQMPSSPLTFPSATSRYLHELHLLICSSFYSLFQALHRRNRGDLFIGVESHTALLHMASLISNQNA
jgi:hypothetical protein